MAFPGQLQSPAGGHAFYEFPAIASVSLNGGRLVWQIRVSAQIDQTPVAIEPDWLEPRASPPAGVVGVIATESYQISRAGVRGQSPRQGGRSTIVHSGKNLGKANATNPVSQALREALGKYNSRKKRDAEPDPGRMERPPPMLVQRHGGTRAATLSVKDFQLGVFVQPKFNGVRLVAYRTPPGPVVFYSRSQGIYPGLAPIRAEVLALLGRRRGRAGAYLDGEIYLHGKPLEFISGQTRKKEDEGDMEFIIFDCFFPEAKAAGRDMPAADRQRHLDMLFDKHASVHVKRAPNFPVKDLAEILDFQRQFLAEGYEGAIARKRGSTYQYGINGYHSSNLVKFKPIHDAEFEVVGYTEGTKGKDVGAVIWICRLDSPPGGPADNTFTVVPKNMSYETRYSVFRCLGEEVAPQQTRFARDFLGCPLTVEFPERSSKTGKPVQAKALTFRTYEGGPREDPLKKLLSECTR